MRKFLNLLLLATIIFSVSCVSVPFKEKTESKVIELPDIKKKEIFNRSRQWFSETFNSGKDVVDYEDKEAGVIIGKGIIYISNQFTIKRRFHIKLKVEAKDEKMRVTTTVLQHENIDNTNGTYRVNNLLESEVKEREIKIEELIGSLKSYIIAQKVKKSDW